MSATKIFSFVAAIPYAPFVPIENLDNGIPSLENIRILFPSKQLLQSSTNNSFPKKSIPCGALNYTSSFPMSPILFKKICL